MPLLETFVLNYDCIFLVCFLLSLSEGPLCVAWASGFLYPVIRGPDLRNAGREQPDERATSNALWQCERTWKNRWIWNVKMFALWNAQILMCTSLQLCLKQRLRYKYPSLCDETFPSWSNFIRQWNFFLSFILAMRKRRQAYYVICWLDLMKNYSTGLIGVTDLSLLSQSPQSHLFFFCSADLKCNFLLFSLL